MLDSVWCYSLLNDGKIDKNQQKKRPKKKNQIASERERERKFDGKRWA